MELFINICGFVGAWLIVAGSIYQAALELKDQDLARDHIEETRKNAPPQKHASTWWWFIPPVKLVLERRLSNAWREAFIKALPDEDVEGLITYLNKATGWVFVGSGGLLLAIKENYELTTSLEVSLWWFWSLTLLMPVLCALNTTARLRRTKRIIHKVRQS